MFNLWWHSLQYISMPKKMFLSTTSTVIVFWLTIIASIHLEAHVLNCNKIQFFSTSLRGYNDMLSSLDPEATRKTYIRFLADPNPTIQMFGGAVKILDRGSMGILGEIYSIHQKPNGGNNKQEMELRVDQTKQMELKSTFLRILNDERNLNLIRAEQLVKSAVPIKIASDGSIIVKASFVSVGGKTGFEQAILHHFQLLGIKTVEFVYRYSSLEPNDPMSSATMIDENVSIVKAGRGYNIHLAFDPRIWKLELQFVAHFYQKYNEARNEEEKTRVINELNQGRSPFLPFSGVVTTDFFVPNGMATEIKRYFSNPLEDPLSILDLPSKNEYEMRMRMLLEVIGGLDDSIPLEIHAHSIVHKRAYLKLGFSVHKEITNPLYPEVVVYQLYGKKQEVMAKLKGLLQTMKLND